MSPQNALANILEPLPASAGSASDDLLVQLWLHGRSPNTQRAYGADIARFRGETNKPLATVKLIDLQEFADTLSGLKRASACRVLSAIKSLLAFGYRTGYLPFDVGRALRLPAVRDNLAQRILPEVDVHRMLSLEPNERNRALLKLLYASGCRVSEICGLAWQDLQATGEGGQITVFGKGGKTRSIQLPASVWKQLLKLRGEAGRDDPVFPSRKKGGFLKPFAVYCIVRRAAERAEIEGKVSPHWFRHAHASHALDRGAPIHLVQATLGHASLATTSRYLHARPKESSSRFLAL
ncbi:MAG TPA: tyrosine-type recombinase/integrase [Terriglobia bacterium]|nr:tyrosine-type recombinase/integrase [Terriglobia bacterium]